MAYGSVVVPTLKSLSEAYILSDDTRYAHKGCILMARLVHLLPEGLGHRHVTVANEAQLRGNAFAARSSQLPRTAYSDGIRTRPKTLNSCLPASAAQPFAVWWRDCFVCHGA